MRKAWPLLPCALVLLIGCTRSNPTFSGSKAMAHIQKLCEFGPHPVGSTAQLQVKAYITRQLQDAGWQVQEQEFTYKGITGYNILATEGQGKGILIGTHYDTRPYADRNPPGQRNQPILGANDGGSGTAVLLELARTLDVDRVGAQVWLAFFDAEDRGNLDGWPFSVGAAFAARMDLNLSAVIVIDMIGDADQQIYIDGNSHPQLSQSIWSLARSMGFSDYFIPQVKYRIIDDHLPFAQKGIPSVLLIDFDYPYWHTTEDTPDKVSPESLERVGQVLERWLEERYWASEGN